ncbi:DUF3108 domain-containing protein [Flavobacterium psychrotolerans]|uniref:DUF3108 domain-containing protein n=1 Tax=Flavobacterium psychrotolerans TaxID=2169410 RepID=A0A2U1JMY5_9FLAO|nr:DUF3108 domain-containing protein [Flavobacterium psychrotolerans]PWA06520.1 DUF3108 domain-containing protein [Flavobacterium psychrotolerans]
MRKLLFILTILLAINAAFAQENKAVKPGEKFIYAASYNMSGLMTQLAQVTMETETVKTSKNTLLHLSCQATTFSKWDTFFKIRDIYESYVNPITLKPSLYKRDIFEGSYFKKEKYIFKNGGSTIESTMNKKHTETKKTFSVGGTTQDVVSILYKLRTVDFNTFKPGQIKSFVVVFDEKEMAVSAKFMGKETVSAGNLGKKECYKISIGAKTKALKGTDKNIIWLTADAAKVPALIKFSIPVGTGQLTLSNASGL